MSVLKKFNETGQEIGFEDVAINETNFQHYLDQYGKNRSEGYKDAYADFVKTIASLLTKTDEHGEWSVSDDVAGRRVYKLHDKSVLTLENLNKLLSDSKVTP